MINDLLGGCVTVVVMLRDDSIRIASVAARSNIICVIASPLLISNFFSLLLISRTFTYPL